MSYIQPTCFWTHSHLPPSNRLSHQHHLAARVSPQGAAFIVITNSKGGQTDACSMRGCQVMRDKCVGELLALKYLLYLILDDLHIFWVTDTNTSTVLLRWFMADILKAVPMNIKKLFIYSNSLNLAFCSCGFHYSHHSSSAEITIHIIVLLWRSLFTSFFFCGHHYSHHSSSVVISTSFFCEDHYSHHSSSVEFTSHSNEKHTYASHWIPMLLRDGLRWVRRVWVAKYCIAYCTQILCE